MTGSRVAETPDSRTGNTPDTPGTPGKTPDDKKITVPNVDTSRQLEKQPPTTGRDTMSLIDSNKSSFAVTPLVSGTPGVDSQTPGAEGALSPEGVSRESGVDDSTRNTSLNTGIPIGYARLNEHGELLREQERVSYQNMLVRYADWPNVRCQVMAYFTLTLLAVIYQGHSIEIESLTAVNASDGRHMQCDCDFPTRQANFTAIKEKLALSHFADSLRRVLLVVVSCFCPLWERFVGRRKILLGLMLTGVPTSVLYILSPRVYYVEQIFHFVMTVCGQLTMLFTISSLIEMLPYEMRYLAVYNYIYGASIATALASIHFNRGFQSLYLGTCCAATSLAGAILVKFYIKDSVCHLNIRNEVDVIEKDFRRNELRLHRVNPEGGWRFHLAVARKVFEDLVYLDQDELKFSEFFRKLWRSFNMFDIVLAIFQAISAGIHDYGFNRYTNERFLDPALRTADRLLGFTFAGILMYYLRKAHRNRALCFLFTAMLLNSSLKHALVDFDVRNHCSSLPVATESHIYMSIVFSVTATAIGHCIQMQILLHFVETTPSILRSTCACLVYLPIKIASDLCGQVFEKTYIMSVYVILVVYSYHVLIIFLTLIRTRSRLPFSLYLFDLMPPSEGENDNHYSRDQITQLRPLMEVTAQPPNKNELGTGRMITQREDEQDMEDTKKEKKKLVIPNPNPKRAFKRVLKGSKGGND